jgi:DNA-binding beta-propeller fold protein YncE
MRSVFCRLINAITLAGLIVFMGIPGVAAGPRPAKRPILRLLHTVPIAGISGDFDHFAVDLTGHRLFLAAEEHKTVEVFNLDTGKPIRSITGFDTPHGLLFLPEKNELLVVDGGEGGSCKVVNGNTYAVDKTIALSPDADALAYDEASHLVYIGNGGKEAGNDYSLISIIDTNTKEHVGDIKIPSTNLEAMALEKRGARLFVNIRDKNQIGVIDRKSRTLTTTWQLNKVNFNTPLSLDENGHLLFVAGRKPGRFGVVDTESGKEITILPASELVDDMSFDPSSNRVYLACGDGFVNVYEKNGSAGYERVAKIATGYKGKIGYLVPELHRYFVATSKHGAVPAKLLIFSVGE